MSTVAESLIGKIGRASSDIEPGSVGEVMIPIRGGSEAFYARVLEGQETIMEGSRVIVIEHVDTRTVYVERYTGV